MCARWNEAIESPQKRCDDILARLRSASGDELFLTYEFLLGPLEKLFGLHPEIPEPERLSLIRGVMDSPNADAMLRRVSEAESKYLSKPKQAYILVSQISSPHFSALKHVSADGIRHTFSRSLPERFDRSEAISKYTAQIHPGTELPTNYTYVRTRVLERYPYAGGLTAQHHLHLLLALWNFWIVHPSITRWNTGAGTTPIAEIRIGPLQTLHQAATGQSAQSMFWYEPTYRRPTLTYKLREQWSDIRHFEHFARRRLNRLPYRKDVVDCLVRYGRALEEVTSYETALVRLFSVLEKLTSSDRYADIRKRTLFIFGDRGGATGLILDDLRDRRNEEVHTESRVSRGGSSRGETYVYALKYFVEELLLFVIKSGHLFKSLRQLGQFLDQPTGENELRQLKRSLTDRDRLADFALRMAEGRPFPGRLRR